MRHVRSRQEIVLSSEAMDPSNSGLLPGTALPRPSAWSRRHQVSPYHELSLCPRPGARVGDLDRPYGILIPEPEVTFLGSAEPRAARLKDTPGEVFLPSTKEGAPGIAALDFMAMLAGRACRDRRRVDFTKWLVRRFQYAPVRRSGKSNRGPGVIAVGNLSNADVRVFMNRPGHAPP
jgi:hypothetical protein